MASSDDLLNERPLVVCLDRCASSTLFIPRKPNIKSLALGDFLIRMAEQGSIVCPIPPEANAETLPLPAEKRLELQKGSWPRTGVGEV